MEKPEKPDNSDKVDTWHYGMLIVTLCGGRWHVTAITHHVKLCLSHWPWPHMTCLTQWPVDYLHVTGRYNFKYRGYCPVFDNNLFLLDIFQAANCACWYAVSKDGQVAVSALGLLYYDTVSPAELINKLNAHGVSWINFLNHLHFNKSKMHLRLLPYVPFMKNCKVCTDAKHFLWSTVNVALPMKINYSQQVRMMNFMGCWAFIESVGLVRSFYLITGLLVQNSNMYIYHNFTLFTEDRCHLNGFHLISAKKLPCIPRPKACKHA